MNGVVIDEGNGTVGLLSRSIENKLHLVICNHLVHHCGRSDTVSSFDAEFAPGIPSLSTGEKGPLVRRSEPGSSFRLVEDRETS